MITTQTLQTALKKRHLKVKLTRAWEQTHHELGVGQLVGSVGSGSLYLSQEDYSLLQAEWDRRTQHAPLSFDLKQDRVAVSGQMKDEKTSGRQVFSGFLRLSSSNGGLSTRLGNYGIPPNSYLGLEDPGLIDLFHYKRLLVIENGALMENLETMKRILPEKYLEDTIYLYRGHDNSAKAVMELIERMDKTQVLGLYFDYDLAGLDMQAKYLDRDLNCKKEMLIPRDKEFALEQYGRGDVYITQMKALKRLYRYTEMFPELRSHVDAMHGVGKGVLQETMLAHEIQLDRVVVRAMSG